MNRNDLRGKEKYEMYLIAKDTINYYKGDILPFVNMNCRTDMTTGDIDCIQWDYTKCILRIVEAKRSNENQSESQHKLLTFLQDEIHIDGYTFDVYKVVGDPPYLETQIFSYRTKQSACFVSFDQLKDFLDMKISFDDLLKNRKPVAIRRAQQLKKCNKNY